MQKVTYAKKICLPGKRGQERLLFLIKQNLRVMKLVVLLITVTCLQVSAASYAQQVTLNKKNASLENIFEAIYHQTGYQFVYSYSLLKKAERVSINVENAPLQEVLKACFAHQPFTYSLQGEAVIVKKRETPLASGLDALIPITVTGTVSDSIGNPLIGVTIKAKSGGTGTVTDASGNYSITVPDDAVLVASYVGYLTKEVAVNGRTQIDIVLAPAVSELDQLVIVGYGQTKKSSLTAAISTIEGSDIAEQPVADLSNALGGRVTGVLFTQPSGLAGNDAAKILIRGVGTNGNSQPLLIVDGIPRNYSQLNPADIASITILKDAAAVAPYGMAGANGVILVTTKRGKTGRPVLTYDGWVGMQSPTVTPHYVNSYQYALLKNAGAVNEGNPEPFSQEVLQKFKDGSDPDAYPNTDPIADIFKSQVLKTSHSLELSGGSETVKYHMGLGYYYQGGLLPKVNYKRYNMSANVGVQATNSTQVSIALNGRAEDRNLTSSGYDIVGLFSNLVAYLPTEPLVFSNGYYTNMYARYYDNPSYQKITGYTLLSQFSIEQQLPVKGLSVKVVGAYDWNPTDPFAGNTSMIQTLRRSWTQPYSYYTIDTTVRPYVYEKFIPTAKPSFSEEYHQAQAFTYQGFINYSGNFGKNALTGMIVLEARTLKASRFSAGRIHYNVPVPELFAGSSVPEDLSNDGTSMESKQRSIVYRLTYGYDNKYLLEAAGRYDGHYYFAPGKRFGFFPAFSVAWRLSEEQFMKNVGWINELKIRGSYGESGQLAGSPFQYLSSFILYGNSAVLNGASTQGLYESTEANPNITWEKARKTDIGINASLWNGVLSLQADYFFEKRNNMLIPPNVTVPVEYGIDIAQVNAGVMENKGFEIAVNGNYNISKDFNVSLNANFTYARNKLIQVFETNATYDNPNRRRTGRPLGTQFGYQALGYFTEDDFDASGNLMKGIPTQPWGKVHPGDIRYADLNGNGEIDVDDQTVIGDPTYPAIVYGFSPTIAYKNFTLSLLFQGAAEKSIQLAEDAVWAFFNGKSAPVTALDYWTPDNTDAPNPRITTTPTQNNMQVSSWWQRSTAYLRLRTGMLSYALPGTVVNKIGMSNLKVYVSGQNLLTWTPLENFDPEISNNRGWYFPTQKSITVGMHIEF